MWKNSSAKQKFIRKSMEIMEKCIGIDPNTVPSPWQKDYSIRMK